MKQYKTQQIAQKARNRSEKKKAKERPVFSPSGKQFMALNYLVDNVTRFLLYGGAAGGGKSYLGCHWLYMMCTACSNTRWFIARNELKRIMSTTYLTWTKVCRELETPDDWWRLDNKYNYIEFKNGSRIDLLDISHQPSDPMYQRLGSGEYTGGWIEEAGETNQIAFDMLKTRIGRFGNDEWELWPPKILLTCNPEVGWLYRLFYKPWKEGELPEDHIFVQAFPDDNPDPKVKDEYLKSLESLNDPIMKERMKFGNWEYESDDTMIFNYDAIIDLFSNTVPYSPHRYITADIARYGADKNVFIVWQGLEVITLITTEKEGIDQTTERLKNLSAKYKVPYSHIVIDEDGVGGGVIDHMRGTKGFMANSVPVSRPDKRENYANLKTQCVYTLGEYVNEHKISLSGIADENHKNMVIDEFQQNRRQDPDKEGRLKIRPKDEIKEIIGRSPDIFDSIVERMIFELRTPEHRKSFNDGLLDNEVVDIVNIY